MACIKICDLCGRRISREPARHFKVKERKGLWEEHWWEPIDVHEVCIRELMEEIHKKEEQKK